MNINMVPIAGILLSSMMGTSTIFTTVICIMLTGTMSTSAFSRSLQRILKVARLAITVLATNRGMFMVLIAVILRSHMAIISTTSSTVISIILTGIIATIMGRLGFMVDPRQANFTLIVLQPSGQIESRLS